jgi:hypothetical protein
MRFLLSIEATSCGSAPPSPYTITWRVAKPEGTNIAGFSLSGSMLAIPANILPPDEYEFVADVIA